MPSTSDDGVDYSKLRSLTARRIPRALEADGFVLSRQKGSHRRYVHTDERRVTLSFHRSSQTFPPATLKSIIEIQACWKRADLERLGLISRQAGKSP
ncbi:MAG: type II toxin-antitoxin system HicA family toxin [Gemmatimonadota bacterium]